MRTGFDSRYWLGIAIGAAMLALFRLWMFGTGWEPKDDGKPYRYAYPEVKRAVPWKPGDGVPSRAKRKAKTAGTPDELPATQQLP